MSDRSCIDNNNFIKLNDLKTTNDVGNNLPNTVTLLHGENGTKVYLVGTAHISEKSERDVAQVIETVQPDIVVLELCPSRMNILQLDEKTILNVVEVMNMEKMMYIIKQFGVVHGLMRLMEYHFLKSYAEIIKKMGKVPGGEMRIAVAEAKKIKNCQICLGDRPIEITMLRSYAKLTWSETFKLFWNLFTYTSIPGEEDIEKAKNRQEIDKMFKKLSVDFPTIAEVFIHERDIYLTHSLQVAATPCLDDNGKLYYRTVVGVVGMAHVAGIEKLWPTQQAQFIPKIISIPAPSLYRRITEFSFKLSFVALSGLLIYRSVRKCKWK